MALPTTNITTSMVRDELGETSESAGGAGNNVGKLCTSNKINKWSKFKPIHLLDAISTTGNSRWYYGTRNNMGLKIARNGVPLSGTLMLSVPNLLRMKEYTYDYERPEGGASSPFRLGDFRGYNHRAKPFVYSGIPSDTYEQVVNIFTYEYGYGDIRIGFNINSDASDYEGGEILLSDLMTSTLADFGFNNLYLCCAVLTSTGTTIFDIFGQSEKIGIVSTAEVYIPVGASEEGVPMGTWKLVFFLGDGWQFGEDDGTEVQHIFPLPHMFGIGSTSWNLRVTSFFPARATIIQIGVLESSFIAGNSNINDSNVNYEYSNYWGGDDGMPDSIIDGAAYYKNLCFTLRIDQVTQSFTVRKNTFTGSSSSTGKNKYQAYIQTQNETFADANSSKTITFNQGTTTYLYVALSNSALFADIMNSIQYGLYCKNAHMCLSTWLQLG